MSITKREITAQWGVHKIINEMWTCSNCTDEIDKNEWFISRLVTTHGYTKAFQCPKCGWNHVWVAP